MDRLRSESLRSATKVIEACQILYCMGLLLAESCPSYLGLDRDCFPKVTICTSLSPWMIDKLCLTESLPFDPFTKFFLLMSQGRTSPQMACSSQQWAQGLALEIDDPNAPGSTYLGSVVEINPGGHQIKVTYVGWASHWDFWVDVLSSTGIHPIGWCQANNKSLILPGNCKS